MQRKSFFFILHIRQLRRYTDVLANRIFCATFHAQSGERRKKETRNKQNKQERESRKPIRKKLQLTLAAAAATAAVAEEEPKEIRV